MDGDAAAGGLFFLLLIAGAIPGGIAKAKGRSFWLWWLFGVFFWIIATPCAILIEPAESANPDHKGAA